MAEIVRLVENGVTRYIETHVEAVVGLDGFVGLSGEVVYSGAQLFDGNSSYSFDAEKMKQGVLLIWSRYAEGTGALDYGYWPVVIPKETIELYYGKSIWMPMATATAGANKVVVFPAKGKIKGHNDNLDSTNNRSQWALRKIVIL